MPGLPRAPCEIFETVAGFKSWRQRLPQSAQIAVLFTKGAIHRGHLVLLRSARTIRTCTHVVVVAHADASLFASEDEMTLFPHDRDADMRVLVACGNVDAVLMPRSGEDLFRSGPMRGAAIRFDAENVTGMAAGLVDGRALSGHLTAILKTTNLVRPAFVVMGLNDIVRCRLVQMMLQDMHVDTEVVAFGAVREDGPSTRPGLYRFDAPDANGERRMVSMGPCSALPANDGAMATLPPDSPVVSALGDALSAHSRNGHGNQMPAKNPSSSAPPGTVGRFATAEALIEDNRRQNSVGVVYSWRLEHMGAEARAALRIVYAALVTVIRQYAEADEFSAHELCRLAQLKLDAVADILSPVHVRIVHPLSLADVAEVQPMLGAFVVIVVRVDLGHGRTLLFRDNVNLGPHVPRTERGFWGLLRSSVSH